MCCPASCESWTDFALVPLITSARIAMWRMLHEAPRQVQHGLFDLV